MADPQIVEGELVDPATGELVLRDDSSLAAADVDGLLDQAERALAIVDTADDGEALFRRIAAIEHAARLARATAETQLRVGRLKFRSERRWGELLGEPVNTGVPVTDGYRLPDGDKMARHRARLVAAVPELVFERYLKSVRDPELLRRARLLRVGREDKAAESRAAKIDAATIVGEIEIRLGDFTDRGLLADLAGTVDAIVTDPPYPAEYRHLYAPLVETAKWLLKPSGSLVVMCGTRPDAWLRLLPAMEQHMPLRWVGCYLAGGPAWRDHQARIATNWKPILIFGGGRNLNSDVWRSSADSAQTRVADTEWHHWGQNEHGFASLIEAFSDHGDLVVDPFIGGGTTAVVCRDLGRRFVGCDVDPAAVAASRQRVAA